MSPHYRNKDTGAKTVGVTAVQLSSASQVCSAVEIMNLSSGTVYIGYANTVTTLNGYAALGQYDRIYLDNGKIGNLNEIYLISDTADQDVRFQWFGF